MVSRTGESVNGPRHDNREDGTSRPDVPGHAVDTANRAGTDPPNRSLAEPAFGAPTNTGFEQVHILQTALLCHRNVFSQRPFYRQYCRTIRIWPGRKHEEGPLPAVARPFICRPTGSASCAPGRSGQICRNINDHREKGSTQPQHDGSNLRKVRQAPSAGLHRNRQPPGDRVRSGSLG